MNVILKTIAEQYSEVFADTVKTIQWDYKPKYGVLMFVVNHRRWDVVVDAECLLDGRKLWRTIRDTMTGVKGEVVDMKMIRTFQTALSKVQKRRNDHKNMVQGFQPVVANKASMIAGSTEDMSMKDLMTSAVKMGICDVDTPPVGVALAFIEAMANEGVDVLLSEDCKTLNPMGYTLSNTIAHAKTWHTKAKIEDALTRLNLINTLNGKIV